MGQKIHTKHYGTVEFEQTWSCDGLHIGRLTDGGYAHLTGLPVQSKDEIIRAIPSGPEQEAALHWWEHRNDPVEEESENRIVMNRDGSYSFEDGSPIESYADITQNTSPGPGQDAMLVWFSEELQRRKGVQTAAETKAGAKAKAVKRNLAPKNPRKRAAAKTQAPPPEKEITV